MIACSKGLGQPRGTPIHRTGAPEASARDNGAYRDTRPKSLAGIAAPHQVRPFLTTDHSVTELRPVSSYSLPRRRQHVPEFRCVCTFRSTTIPPASAPATWFNMRVSGNLSKQTWCQNRLMSRIEGNFVSKLSTVKDLRKLGVNIV